MPADYESMARMVMSTPQGKNIIKGLDKFNAVASSEGGKQLIAMIAGSGGDAIKSAAQAASQAQSEQGRVLLSNLLSTKDGAALVAKLIEIAGV